MLGLIGSSAKLSSKRSRNVGQSFEEMAWVNDGVNNDGFVEDLKNVRDLLIGTIQSELPLLSKVTFDPEDHTEQILRTSVLFLSGRFGEVESQDRVAAAATIELVCMAHDIHTNVLESETEENICPDEVNAQGINWCNMFSVMAGNYLLTKSYAFGAEFGDGITKMLSRASGEICFGKMLELKHAFDASQSEEICHDIAEKKTATRYQFACSVGASLAGASDAVVHQLSEYGRNLGIAIHLTNQVHDILAEEDRSFHNRFALDLREGFYGLPVIWTLRSGESENLRQLLWQSKLEDQDIDMAISILRSNDSLSYVWQKARFFADQAKENLRSLPQCAATQSLADIADYVMNNVHDAKFAPHADFVPEKAVEKSNVLQAAGH